MNRNVLGSLLLVGLLAQAAASSAWAQGEVNLYGTPGAGSSVGTAMGGFHGTGTGGGFYHPSWGPSMPGYYMPREQLPTLPPFDGNLVKPVTPFAPMSKQSFTGGTALGLHEKPQFGPRPSFNWTPHAPQPNMAPRYTPGFNASALGYPNGAKPDFNAFSNRDAQGQSDIYQSHDNRPPTNISWPNAANPRWWPKDLSIPVQDTSAATQPIGQRPWPN